MLVVVHYGDVEFFLQAGLNFKAFRGFDIFEVDTAKSGGNGFDYLDETLRIFLIDFDVEGIYSCINLEEKAFSLHHRFTSNSTNVT